MEKQVVDAVYGGRRKGAQKKMEAAQEKYQLANDAYKKYYTKLGMTRQSAWQVDRTSRGLCRLCSQEADYGGMCNPCRDKQRQHLEKVQAKRRESHGIV